MEETTIMKQLRFVVFFRNGRKDNDEIERFVVLSRNGRNCSDENERIVVLFRNEVCICPINEDEWINPFRKT